MADPQPADPTDPAARAFLSGVASAGDGSGGPVGGYGPEARGVYVPPGGTQAVDIQTGKPVSNVVPFPSAPQQGGGNLRDRVKQEWINAGYSPAAADGIAQRIQVESGFDPHNIGDGGTSFGLYQHHADRARALHDFATKQGADAGDPIIQTKFAIAEMNGLDPTAARSRDALMKASDSQAAYGIFTRSFERPAGSPGSEETNLATTAFGPFNAAAGGVLGTLVQDIQKRSQEYDAALAEAKNLRTVSRVALAKWALESEHPPKDQRENWSQWVGAASAMAMIGGFFGKNHTAAINAAGEMLQAANAADVRAYDIAYKNWKTHSDNGLKMIELLHGEARDIVDDARKSYDQKVTELATLSTAYQLQQRLDPSSLENIEKRLTVLRTTAELTKAQNSETELRNATKEKDDAWLKDHPEAKTVPAEVHVQHEGEVKHAASGTGQTGVPMSDDDAKFAARQYLAGDRTVLSGLGYGNTGAANRQKVRSAIRAEAEAQGKSPEEVAMALAEFEGTRAGERTLGQVGARADRAVYEADNMAELVVQKSDAFPRTDFVPVNRALEAAKRGTGDTHIAEFAASLNSFINAYARAISPTGQATISDKDHAREMLETAQTPAQVRAVIGVLRQEMQFALQATGQAKKQLRGGEPSASPAPSTSPGSSVAVPPAYASDPDGTSYQKDGQTWVKKGGQLILTPGAVETGR